MNRLGQIAVVLLAVVFSHSVRILADSYYGPSDSGRPARQGTSQWSFDPYLNKFYTIDLASRVNMSEFAVVDGVPAAAVAGGEQQYYNLSADGSTYMQYVFFPSGADFNSQIPFVLGQSKTVPLPGNQTITYKFDMTNATQVRIDIDKDFGDHHAVFIIYLTWNADGSGYSDLVQILQPSPFEAHAWYNRTG
ncbi:uncharacterized protein LOC129592556 [Paramacrobiotus metropolitanus]|uniref:uncharacterized protein LOC129592556 n=1 Tax=Paramacrobiotus metropolitanus TaxID=2943436 RepID=UPI002445BCFF|nr:uncharacterized protein LOC129592556 [Paramacrobiotus metropolitanus]